MKTVRFSNVVAQCGHPEIYLVLQKDDPDFARALKAHRIMSIVGDHAASAHGEVGFQPNRRAQLLLFPKSLAKFDGARIVGIKYESFAESRETHPELDRDRGRKVAAKAHAKPRSAPAEKTEPKSKKSKPAAAASKPPDKIISFPQPAKEDAALRRLKQQVRKALFKLEKDRPMQAARLLTAILKSS